MLVVFVVVACIPLFSSNPFTLRLFITAFMTATLAMGFDFTNGYIGICNFGYAAFWGVGAYTSAILVKDFHMPLLIGMLGAVAITAAMGVIIGCLTIRLGGIFASCMCWFVSLALLALARNLVDLTGGASGYSATFMFKPKMGYMPYFYVMFALMVVIFILLSYFTHSTMGLAFRAIALDSGAAGSSGINHVKYKLANFCISCAIAGLVGAFYIHFVGIMTPTSMNNEKTTEIMAICFIGGRGTIWGSVLSSLVMTPVLERAKNLLEWRQIIYGLLMILIMIFYPRGMAGVLEKGKGQCTGGCRRTVTSWPAKIPGVLGTPAKYTNNVNETSKGKRRRKTRKKEKGEREQ